MISSPESVNRVDLDRIDVCVTDFDGCMYPGISKVAVARDVALALAATPKRGSDRRHIPKVGVAAGLLVTLRLWQRLTGHVSDGDLVRFYARLLGTVPRGYFRDAAAAIPPRLLPGVEEAFAWLTDRWPVGVISLALMEVLQAVEDHLAASTGGRFAFICGNRIDELNAKSCVRPVLSAGDKRFHMADQLARLGCRRPLVIGHDREDLGLVALAREMGGVSLGFKPRPEIADRFDLIVQSGDWREVPILLGGRVMQAEPQGRH
jgi:phosphoglycolate phosphatase-like HAD superfamily hydrolase